MKITLNIPENCPFLNNQVKNYCDVLDRYCHKKYCPIMKKHRAPKKKVQEQIASLEQRLIKLMLEITPLKIKKQELKKQFLPCTVKQPNQLSCRAKSKKYPEHQELCPHCLHNDNIYEQVYSISPKIRILQNNITRIARKLYRLNIQPT